MKTKECNRCGETKLLTGFYKHEQTVDGRYGACKECRKGYQRDYQKRNNDRIVDHHREYRKGLCAGVYTITNTVSGKVYVGESSECIRRISDHKKRLKRSAHRNAELQEDYNKHGKAFDYEVIKELPAEIDKRTRLQEEAKAIQTYLNEGVEVYNQTMAIIKKDKP